MTALKFFYAWATVEVSWNEKSKYKNMKKYF